MIKLSLLLNWFKELTPSCRQVSRLQSRLLDESLAAHTRLGMKGHLLYCTWCRRYGRQLNLLRRSFRGDVEQLTNAAKFSLPPEVRQKMKDFLRKELS